MFIRAEIRVEWILDAVIAFRLLESGKQFGSIRNESELARRGRSHA